MNDPLMARMASQMRQQQIADLKTAMSTAVTAGDTAEALKITDRYGELMAQEAASKPQPKFSATDVRAALNKLAPEAVKDLNIRAQLGNVANNIANGTIDISDFGSPEELATAMLKAAGHTVVDPKAAAAEAEAAAAKKKADDEAAAKKKLEEEAAARAAAAGEDGDGEGEEDDEGDDEDDEGDDEGEEAAAAAARRAKPARPSREEPSLGSGRPAAARSLDKIKKVAELPKESRAGWDRMTKGGMQTVVKAAAAGDALAKEHLAKAEANYVEAEVRRLKAQRKK